MLLHQTHGGEGRPNRTEPAVPDIAAPGVLTEFAKIEEPVHPSVDRKLGYFGEVRFVLFHWERRADGVIWKDGRTYGFGPGAWCFFLEKISPLADMHDADLGTPERDARHVLLVDRWSGQVYFAPRDQAEQLVASQHE
jgi:hypothetical protein